MSTAPAKQIRTDAELSDLARSLERARQKIARLKDEADAAEADLIAGLADRGSTFIQHDPRCRACVEVPVSRSIDHKRFVDFCRNRFDPDDVDKCIKRSVLLGQAKKLLDDDDLERIVDREDGKPRIAFHATDPESED